LFQRVQEFDAQLSINVRANSAPWSLATLRPALQRQGMEARPDGRLVMPDGEGGVLFTVIVNSTPAEETCELITLLLPVARVAPEHDGFKAMSALAKSLASRLSGTVVDDNGQPLSDAALAVIAAQVREFCQAMEQARLPAGSARALRLFA
jgi:FtsZ-interacting cell division protein ZipA